jgi:toxin HigB-1
VIKTWANSATQQFAESGKSKFSGLDPEAADDALSMLDAATSLSDDRKGQWAMTINGPWRLCFRFEDGDAHDVEIVDYH